MNSDQEIIDYLTSFSTLERIVVLVNEDTDPGLIYYVGKSGEVFISMEDNDLINDAAISYLIRNGAEVVSNQDQLDSAVSRIVRDCGIVMRTTP